MSRRGRKAKGSGGASEALRVLRERVQSQKGWGPRTTRTLLTHFGTAEAVLLATDEDLRAVPGIGEVLVTKVREALEGVSSPRVSPTASSDVVNRASPRDPELSTRIEALKRLARISADLEEELGSERDGVLAAQEGLAQLEERLVEQLVERRGVRRGFERVTVAVIGDFSSGKSTFVNALLGERLCPTDPRPTTSSVTHFTHGPKLRIEREGADGSRQLVSEKAYVQGVKHGGEGAQAASAVFHVEHPSRTLRGLHLIDTPGFNNAENPFDTRVTETAVREADVLFVVFDVNKGNPSATLLEQLERIRTAEGQPREQPAYLLLNQAAKKQSPRERKAILEANKKLHGADFRRCLLVDSKALARAPEQPAIDAVRRELASAERAIHRRADFEVTISGGRARGALGKPVYSVAATGPGEGSCENTQELPFFPNEDLATRDELLLIVAEVLADKHKLVDRRLKHRQRELKSAWKQRLQAVEALVKDALAARATSGDGVDAAKLDKWFERTAQRVGEEIEGAVAAGLQAAVRTDSIRTKNFFGVTVKRYVLRFSIVRSKESFTKADEWRSMEKAIEKLGRQVRTQTGVVLPRVDIERVRADGAELVGDRALDLRQEWVSGCDLDPKQGGARFDWSSESDRNRHLRLFESNCQEGAADLAERIRDSIFRPALAACRAELAKQLGHLDASQQEARSELEELLDLVQSAKELTL